MLTCRRAVLRIEAALAQRRPAAWHRALRPQPFLRAEHAKAQPWADRHCLFRRVVGVALLSVVLRRIGRDTWGFYKRQGETLALSCMSCLPSQLKTVQSAAGIGDGKSD